PTGRSGGRGTRCRQTVTVVPGRAVARTGCGVGSAAGSRTHEPILATHEVGTLREGNFFPPESEAPHAAYLLGRLRGRRSGALARPARALRAPRGAEGGTAARVPPPARSAPSLCTPGRAARRGGARAGETGGGRPGVADQPGHRTATGGRPAAGHRGGPRR